MAKKLKYWNGGCCGESHMSIYIAAYSIKQAAELADIACYGNRYGMFTPYNIKTYFPPCWGNSMDGIIPTEPCVYVQKDWKSKPEKIYPK